MSLLLSTEFPAGRKLTPHTKDPAIGSFGKDGRSVAKRASIQHGAEMGRPSKLLGAI